MTPRRNKLAKIVYRVNVGWPVIMVGWLGLCQWLAVQYTKTWVGYTVIQIVSVMPLLLQFAGILIFNGCPLTKLERWLKYGRANGIGGR